MPELSDTVLIVPSMHKDFDAMPNSNLMNNRKIYPAGSWVKKGDVLNRFNLHDRKKAIAINAQRRWENSTSIKSFAFATLVNFVEFITRSYGENVPVKVICPAEGMLLFCAESYHQFGNDYYPWGIGIAILITKTEANIVGAKNIRLYQVYGEFYKQARWNHHNRYFAPGSPEFEISQLLESDSQRLCQLVTLKEFLIKLNARNDYYDPAIEALGKIKDLSNYVDDYRKLE